VLGLPPAFNLSHDQTLQFKFDAQRIKLRNELRVHSETWYFFFVLRHLRIRIFECPHRLSDKLLKSSATRLSLTVARSRIIRFPRSESSVYFRFSLPAFPEESLLTRRFVIRCSVSVEAHYREFFRDDKHKFKKTYR
ncbi:hypothetical protein, partial [Klebsiella sp. RIT-PI-d]|uniref:hypothetical protein n=1 Tax=Klebsiella sp. RIT-PI-d TaxID=1681196 RepID=UPI0019D6E7A2